MMYKAIFCVLLAAVAISADLQSDIDDIARHIPMEQLVLIGQKYVATDPSVRPGLRYIDDLDFNELVEDFVNVKEVHDLVEYFNRRGIDAKRIILHLAKMAAEFNHNMLKKQSAGQIRSSSPVISGDFIADCLGVISVSDLSAVVHQKLETSSEFGKLAVAIEDPEFKTLIYRALNSKSFAGTCIDCNDILGRGFWSNVWSVAKPVIVKVASSYLIGMVGK